MISNISAFYLSSSLMLCFNYGAHLRPLIKTDGSFTYPVAHLSPSVKIQIAFVGDNTQKSPEL